MKIAVFHNLPSGGAQRALYNFVKYLVLAGNQVDLYVPSTADETLLNMKALVANHYSYTAGSPLGRKIRSTLHLRPRLRALHKAIAEDINSRDYDVVFSEQDQYTLSPFLLRYITKPTVYYCQQPSRLSEAIILRLADSVKPRKQVPFYSSFLRKYLDDLGIRTDRENASFASYVIANSYFSREAILRSYGLNAFVSYLGTDAAFFKPLSLPRESFVLSVGSCHPHKGFDFLIRSLSILPPSLRPPLLIVSNVVSTAWSNHLTQLAGGLGVRLEIRERVSDSELVTLYNRARVFVYAPYLEPFGLAPLEAMACGTPVVAVKEGGVRESVSDGVTGVLTERDEAAFADALRDILNDGVKRDVLGRNGFDTVHGFWTLEHAGERLQCHLKRAINQDARTVEGSQPPSPPQSHPVPSSRSN